jgi:hypothetical protein
VTNLRFESRKRSSIPGSHQQRFRFVEGTALQGF